MSSSQTRKKGSTRSPKHFNGLEWLRDPMQQLKRSVSFEGTEITDEEFYRFFNAIGEVNRSKSRSKSASKTRKSPKSPKPKSPKPKSPKPGASKSK